MTETKLRISAVITSLLFGCACIALITQLAEGRVAEFLVDKNSDFFPYPFTIQNTMWLMFFVGIGELLVRLRRALLESRQIEQHLLPENDEAMLRSQDLGQYYARLKTGSADQKFFLQKLIARTILQFQSSRSVNQANSLLNSSLELFQHEVEIHYSMLRYIIWLIPTLGFIGTVVGIALALNKAGATFSAGVDLEDSGALLVEMTGSLGVAFYTTLLALILSAVLVFIMHIAQAGEEKSLNQAGQYCLDNLINRLYEK